MKRLLLLVVLLPLVGCTRAEIAAVTRWYAETHPAEVAPAPEAEPVAPLLEVSGDCSTFTVSVTGYPEGAFVLVGLGGDQFGWDVDAPSRSFPVAWYDTVNTNKYGYNVFLRDAPQGNELARLSDVITC